MRIREYRALEEAPIKCILIIIIFFTKLWLRLNVLEAAESLAAFKSLVLANIEQWDHLLWPSNT